MPPTSVSASVDTGTIRHRFNFEWATSSPIEDIDTYWWWARSIRVDPNEVIADDDEGNLWSIPFTTDGADEITFGTPVRVRETFVPVAEGDGVAATAAVTRRRQRVAAANLSRPTKPTSPEHPRASTGPQGQEESQMDYATLRAEHGIADDISDDEIGEVLAALSSAPDDDDAPAAEDAPAEEPVADPVPVAAAADDPEKVALRSTVDNLLAREQARATREATETRESVLSAAVSAGRISPHERATIWEPFYDAKPAEATTQLAKLPANRVPVTELGYAGGSADDVDARYAELTAGAPTYDKRS